MSQCERRHPILRPATSADVAVIRHWDQQPHIIAAKGNEDWGWETELKKALDWREQLIAEVDGRPIGFVQIIDPALDESHYWGGVAEGPSRHRYLDWGGTRAEEGIRHADDKAPLQFLLRRTRSDRHCMAPRRCDRLNFDLVVLFLMSSRSKGVYEPKKRTVSDNWRGA